MPSGEVDKPAAETLAALPIALMGFAGDGRLSFVTAEMLALLRQPAASLPIGMPEGEALRCLALGGMLGAGDPEARLGELLAMPAATACRRLVRGAGGSGLELRLAPLPGGGRVLCIADVSALLAEGEGVAAQARAVSEVLARLNTGVAQYDAARRLAHSNPAYARLLGLDPQVLQPGMPVDEVVRRQRDAGEFDAETAEQAAARMSGYPKDRAWRAERTRVNGRTFRIDNQPLPEGGWLAEITDISDKHAAEQEARGRVAVHDALMEALPVGVAVYSPERVCTLVNPAYNRIMAHSPIAVGDRLHDILLRRALTGEYGSLADPEAEVRRRLRLVEAPYSFDRRVAGVAVAYRSMPLPDGGHAMVVTDVTALQNAQAEIRERAELFSTMIESTRHGIAMFDAEGRVVAANRLAARLSSVPPDRFVPGASLAELRALQIAVGAHGDEEATARFLAARSGSGLRGADRYRRLTRAGTTIEVVTDQLPDGGFVRSYTDVTAQVAAEAEATRRAATLQAVLDNMRHGVVLYDAQGHLVTANGLAADLAGIPRERMIPGVHFETLRDLQIAAGEYREDQDGERYLRSSVPEPWRRAASYTRRRPDGSVLEIRSDLTPDGGCIRTFTDITALTRAREESAAHAAMVQAMLDNMRHGIAMFDAEGRLLAANALCGELMGIGDALRPGMTDRQILQAQAGAGEFGSAEEAAGYVEYLLGLGGDFGVLRRRRPDGTELEVVGGEVPGGGFVLTLTDITARVLAEREVERRAEVLATTLNATQQAITLYDAERRVVASNDVAANLAGFPDGTSMIGRAHAEVIAGQRRVQGIAPDGDPAGDAFLSGLDRRQRHRYQWDRSDGSVLDMISDPVSGGGYVVSAADVTALVRAREEAQAQAAALAATLDASRNSIILYGPDRRVVATNRITLDLTGYATVEEMVGKTYEEIATRQAQQTFGEHHQWFVRELLAIDRTRSLRYQRRLPNGRVRDVASDPTPDGGFVVSISDVTELVDAREEAQRRAGILQVMLDNNPQGIALFDREKRLVAANALAGDLMGLPQGLLLPGMPLREILRAQRERGVFDTPGEDAAAWEVYFASMDRSVSHRTQRNLPDGRRVDITSDPTPDGGYVVAIADISPLVRAEAAAEQRAGILRTMLENNTSGILLYGADRRLVAYNTLAAEFSEVADLEACIGGTLEENLAVQARAGSLGLGEAGARNLERLSRLDRSVAHRNRRLTRDGRTLIVSSDPTPDGGFVVSQTDVTAVVRAEAEAARRAEILGVMLGNIRHGIALFDTAGSLVASNAKLLEMLELPEVLLPPGMSFSAMVEMLHGRGEYGQGEEARRRADSIQAHPRGRPIRSTRTRPNGAIMEVVSDPTPDGGWVVTYTDVTEDRRVRAELEAARASAESANRAKSRFLATMSHELRTPLNAVIGFSEVLHGRTTPDQVEEFAAAIQEAGRHLLSLIDDILDVTRAENGNLPVVVETVALAPLLESAARIIGAAAASGQLLLATDTPPWLPRLEADERRLRQILLNLLSNATKFTPAGGEIVLRARADASGLTIEVSDTGIGIAAADIERVFEPFTQIDSTLARRFPGSGLGLHLCRALTEAQGGTLTLTSTPGIGTTARVRFPIDRILEADRPALAPAPL